MSLSVDERTSVVLTVVVRCVEDSVLAISLIDHTVSVCAAHKQLLDTALLE